MDIQIVLENAQTLELTTVISGVWLSQRRSKSLCPIRVGYGLPNGKAGLERNRSHEVSNGRVMANERGGMRSVLNEPEPIDILV